MIRLIVRKMLRELFRFQLDPEKDYEYRDVVQKPLAPAYSEVLERMKTTSLKHGSIKVEYDKKKD